VPPIRSAAELYAHAIAIEREAAQRYGELAGRMLELGHQALAEVLDGLAQFEGEHLLALERRTAGMALPAVTPGEFRWLDGAAPESLPGGATLTTRQALALALHAERRAQAFFENVCMTAEDPALRRLAQEMALEESAHIELIERLLETQESGSEPGL
jgi:rubrerythrin